MMDVKTPILIEFLPAPAPSAALGAPCPASLHVECRTEVALELVAQHVTK